MTTSIDADYATVGGLLLVPVLIDAVSGWLRAEDFARPVCGEVYQVISDMRARQLPVDPVTALGELRRLGRVRSDGYPASELIAMVEAVPVPRAAPYYARLVLAAAVFRQVEACGTRLRQVGRRAHGEPEDAFNTVAQSWQKLAELRGRWRHATGVAPASGTRVRDPLHPDRPIAVPSRESLAR
jgi:replicative DNA helicase